MNKRRICPKCRKLSNFIYHGWFRLKNGHFVQRTKCLVCKKTVSIPSRYEFFSKMRIGAEELDFAMDLYIEGNSIKNIASQLKTRPNTIIDWIKRVKNRKSSYENYLKIWLHYHPSEVRWFFKRLSAPEKRKRTRRLIAYSKNRSKRLKASTTETVSS